MGEEVEKKVVKISKWKEQQREWKKLFDKANDARKKAGKKLYGWT